MDKKMWGGRFKKEINQGFFRFQQSIHLDRKLAEYDICHSIIHATALGDAGMLGKSETERLTGALYEILEDVRSGGFEADPDCEDIHTDIQNRVREKAGDLANKLHTLRSRNDQVAFDLRWCCCNEGAGILDLTGKVLSSLRRLGAKYKDVCVPGYTHTRRAQVVSFPDYIGAFSCMFERDAERLRVFVEKTFSCIGSGALAGSAIPRSAYSSAIKQFLKRSNMKINGIRTVANPLDNVADRDFVIELLSILSMLQGHLSRLSEDFILYSTGEFDFFDLPEEFCTGSSLMPHKKNPDFLELVRGYSGKIFGNLVSVLTIMKGLPSTYNRDMQLDKEPLFSSVELIKSELDLMRTFLQGVSVNRNKVLKALENEELYATELVEFLVGEGVPFKAAHDAIGRLIRCSEEKNIGIKDMPGAYLSGFNGKLSAGAVKRVMTPEYAISSKKSLSRKQRSCRVPK